MTRPIDSSAQVPIEKKSSAGNSLLTRLDSRIRNIWNCISCNCMDSAEQIPENEGLCHSVPSGKLVQGPTEFLGMTEPRATSLAHTVKNRSPSVPMGSGNPSGVLQPTSKELSQQTQSWSDPVLFCWNPRRPLNVVCEYPDTPIYQAGLRKLEAVSDFVKIKGDGHCLFRAISTGMLCRYASLDQQEKMEFRQKLNEIRADVGKLIPEAQWKLMIDSFDGCDSREKAIERMNTPTSNGWVAVMRQLAVAQIKKDPDLEMFLDADNHADYLRDMADSTLHAFGGPVETRALSNIFGVDMEVHQLKDLGSGQAPLNFQADKITLIFQGDEKKGDGHYNLALSPLLSRL